MTLVARIAGDRWVAAIGVAIVALAAHGPGLAAAPGEAALQPKGVGEPAFCMPYGDITYADPLAALELSGGDSLIVPWVKKGWALLWLSRDGRTLRAVDADSIAGHVHGLVQLPGNRALVAAEDGLFLFEGGLNVRRLLRCEQTGAAQLVASVSGGVLAFSDGSLLVQSEQGLMRLTTSWRLETIAALPPDADQFRVLIEDALLVSGAFGHSVIARGGRTEVLATGPRTLTHLMTPGVPPEMRSGMSRGEHIARSVFGMIPPPISGAAVLDSAGRMRWAVPPGDVVALSNPIELRDGRVFFLSDRGLMRLREDGALHRVSTAVRMSCSDSRAWTPWARSLPDGRTVVQVNGVLFAIDGKDRVVPILRPESCERAIGEDDVAATPDGWIYYIHGDRLLRADRNGRSGEVPVPEKTDRLYSVKAYGADLLLKGSSGVFHLRGDGRLARLVPGVAKFDLLSDADLDGRPLICVEGTLLHRLDADGKLQPVAGVVAEHCWGVRRVGSMGLLMSRDRDSHVLITGDGRVIDIGGARAWHVTQLRDGSAVLGVLPRARYESTWRLDEDEEAALPHAMIRVWPDGRIEPIPFEGRDLALKSPDDPLWPERRQIRSVHFSSPSTGWAIFGKRSLLSATSDAGATWKGVVSGGETIQGVSALHFTADGRHGIAVGSDVIWRTDNSGAGWVRVPYPTGMRDIREVSLLEPAGVRAFAIAEIRSDKEIRTQVIGSRDGGLTWVPEALPLPGASTDKSSERSSSNEAVYPGYQWLRYLQFDLSGRNGVVVGAGRVMTTEDGGDTWRVFADLRDYAELERSLRRLESSKPVHLAGMSMERLTSMPLAIARWPRAEPWCVAQGKLFCIKRGAEPDRPDVTEIELAPDALIAAMAVASDQKHAWAVGTAGTIVTTEDGGRNWSTQSRDARTTLVGIHFLPDSLHGWTWGDDGLLLTRDGGRTWMPAAEPTSD